MYQYFNLNTLHVTQFQNVNFLKLQYMSFIFEVEKYVNNWAIL